jgi:uncharacterized protein (DUF433 family)
MHERIEINPAIQHGRPVIRGTRVPVAMVLNLLAGGDERERIAHEFGITTADIEAALMYALELVEAQQQRPIPASR